MKSALVIFLFALPLFCFGQNEVFKGEHFIEVTGTAHQEIEPNEITVIVRLKEFEENRSKTPLEKLDKDFMNALKDADIDRKRLELADIGSNLEKFRRRDKDAFREKTYQLKLSRAAELERFLEALQSVKVDHVDITRVTHSQIDKLKLELKGKALQAAKAKAEFLLQAIGAQVGKPLMVRDWEIEPVQPMFEGKIANMVLRNQESDMDTQAEAPQIGFRKIRLQAQITAQFEIK
jgi:hypothetical protein